MGQVYTVEDVNPRGQSIKETEMSIRRGRALSRICAAALTATGDPQRARVMPPFGQDYPAKQKDLVFVFGEPLYAVAPLITEWWTWIWDSWYSGALERTEQVALANLPLSVRKKLSVTGGDDER